MKASKPVFMKTYGKEKRKMTPWLMDNRKQAFDTTTSTDGDCSMFEPAQPAGKRTTRPAKKKAMRCLAEKSCNETTASPPSSEPLQTITTRGRKVSVTAGRPTRLTRKKAVLLLTDSSDEENIGPLSPPCPPPALQSSTSSGHLRSSRRFVTHRRGAAAATKPRVLTARGNTLNSSDDFTSAAVDKRRTLRPLRKNAPLSFLVSSAENSVNVAGISSFPTNPPREISINQSMELSVGPCPGKPIFCSTPSAGGFIKRPRLKDLPTNPSLTALSSSVSCIGVLKTSQEGSPGPSVSLTSSSPPVELHSEVKPQSSGGEQVPDQQPHKEPTADLGEERSSGSKEGNSRSEELPTDTAGELASLKLLLTEDSEGSSSFVSAAAGLEWLVEALKENCLNDHCTVQLKRLDISWLFSQSNYSSCLGLSSSATHKQPMDSCHTIEHSGDDLVNSSQPSEHATSVTDSQSTNKQPSTECSPTQEATNWSTSGSTHHQDDSVEVIADTQLAANEPISRSSALALVIKNNCLTRNCTIQLKRMSLSQQESETDQIDIIEDSDDETCSEEVTEKSEESLNSNNSQLAQTQSADIDTDEKAAALAAMLKEKCRMDKVRVEIKRLTLSKRKLQLKATKPETHTEATEETSATQFNVKKTDLSSSEDKSASDKEEVANPGNKRRKTSVAPREKKTRGTPKDRAGNGRKVCVSGLSVSRWKNQSAVGTHVFRSRTKMVDCSINDLIPVQHRQPREPLTSAMNFSTPVRANCLTSMLADLTPSTHTWSRLKAALSVHRKSKVLHTPGRLPASVLDSPCRAKLADISQDLFTTPYRTPLHKLLRSQLQSPASLVECEDADLSDEEKVCAECGQPRPLPWEECVLPQRMKQCVKIGEGTFGEVFSTTNASGDTVALKIIPVEGSEKVNGEDQKTFGEILHEIIISKELSSLKEKQQNKTEGFIGLNDLHCVQGCYPPDFLKAWDAFDQRKGSENDRPDFFGKDQLFIILEFEFGGSDLENSNGTLPSLAVAKSILHQVTAALAVAEQELHFEHRDLHWGNVLVKTTKQKTAIFLLNGSAHSVETKGLLVRIIDYSLSRLEIDDLTVSCDISKDEELFQGQGDYQFDIYRLMRTENGNDWSEFHPRTNVLWLHYLCSKLLAMKYRCSGGRGAKAVREELARFHDNVLQYRSATETLQLCPLFQ